MCEPMTLALAATAAAGGLNAYGQYQQGQATKQVAYNNARMAEYAAADAQRRGEENATAALRRARQVKGAQRARLAAAGLDLTSGTPADLQDQTDFFGESDANTARFNGAQEAWSSRAQAAGLRGQGDAAATQGSLSSFATILGTGAQVAGKWDVYTGSNSSYSYNNDASGWKHSSTGAEIRGRR